MTTPASPAMRRLDTRITVSASAASVVSTLPAFLVGASSVLVRLDIPMSDATFGAAISLFFVAAALSSVGGGRMAERLGAGQALVISAAMTTAALVGLSLMPADPAGLFVLLGVAGVAHGTAQPAANLVLTGTSADRRQAFRFGVKQASIPLATLFAGISIPIVGSTMGWRWGFALAAIGSAGLAAVMTVRPLPVIGMRSGPDNAPERRKRTITRPLVALAIAAGVGSSAATAIPSFLSQTATNVGFSVNAAGWIMALGSVVGILARLIFGWFSPPRGGPALKLVTVMLAVGALGYLALGLPNQVAVIVGSVVAFGFGWGWPGLFHFAVVTLHPESPGAASGIGQSGASAGAAIGPFMFGFIASLTDYRFAWTVAAAAAASSAVAMWGARRWIVARGGRDAA